MNTWAGFPLPKDGPAPGSCIRVERPEDGLVFLHLDPPHRSLAVFDGPLLKDLDAALHDLEHDQNLKAVVLAGADPLRFAGGADLDAIAALDDPTVLEEVVLAVHKLFRRLEKLPARTVAAIGGPVPGGACEISLCCDFIVAADHPKTRIGLPETQLGIIPGWGGCHRLPRRIGLPAAMQAILSGKLYPAKKAKNLRMIDRVTAPEYLWEVAANIAMKRERVCPVSRGWKHWLVDRNPILMHLVSKKARQTVMKKTRGKYPAPLKAISLVANGTQTPLEEGAKKEARAIAKLASGSVCKSLVRLFQASEAAKKWGKNADGTPLPPLQSAGVVGGGIMGGAIASSFAMKGITTRLADLSQDAVDTALQEHRKDVAKKIKRRRLQRHQGMAAVDALDGTTSIHQFSQADLVLEAVAERLEIKQSVFQEIAANVSENTLLATNTSSLSVTKIAEGIPHPERVVGMHFFNPVKRMPLVEVIQGEQTSEETVRRVAALALRLGKTPVIVKDVAGFLVNRILGPYLDEAIRLFLDGADIQKVDKLLVDFGMPMGPFRLLDEVGLDIAMHAGQSLYQAYGERMKPASGLESLSSESRLGRKTGKGFYDYSKGKKEKPTPCPDLASFQTRTVAKNLPKEDVVDRLVLSMVNEGLLCLQENVVAGPQELDLATVFGTGFAPFEGGLYSYAQQRGIQNIEGRLLELGKKPLF